jgi:hypothetical protein
MINFNYSDIPSSRPCIETNNKLWELFCSKFSQFEKCSPNSHWSEAEVVQYLDNLKELQLKKNIFYIGPKYVYKTHGQMSDMYVVDDITGDYFPYDSDNLWTDVQHGLSIMIRPAEEHELDWADRKVQYYHYNLTKRFQQEYF